MALRAQFQMLILALNLALNINSTPHFNLVQLLVQNLLLQSLLKITAPLADLEDDMFNLFVLKKKPLKTIFN